MGGPERGAHAPRRSPSPGRIRGATCSAGNSTSSEAGPRAAVRRLRLARWNRRGSVRKRGPHVLAHCLQSVDQPPDLGSESDDVRRGRTAGDGLIELLLEVAHGGDGGGGALEHPAHPLQAYGRGALLIGRGLAL